MNSYKKWLTKSIILTIFIIFPLVFSVMYFNYYIDPLWNFNHKNALNDYQIGFDERQQKTNYIVSHPFDYDSLLIGTSRVTYMNQYHFQNSKVFNYSLSSLNIDEYLPYIEFAKKQNGKPFKKIYMELYFESIDETATSGASDPNVYFNKSLNPLYKFKSLFSYNTYLQAMDNLKYSKANEYGGFRSYNRDNVGATTYKNLKIDLVMKTYPNTFNSIKYKGSYPYDPNYKQKLAEIKKLNPQSEFVVFSNPIPSIKLKTMLNDPIYWNAFVHWYNDMIDIFGKVYCFETINPITSNPDNWFDTVHYYPSIGDLMIDQLEGRGKKSNFCIVITKENLNQYLNRLKNEIK